MTLADDRAEVGYNLSIVTNQQNTNFAVRTWQLLLAGEKVLDAERDAAATYPLQQWLDYNTPPSNSKTVPVLVSGDPTMTLSGKVYQWVSGPTWYK